MMKQKKQKWIHLVCNDELKDMVSVRAASGDRKISQQVRYMLSIANHVLESPKTYKLDRLITNMKRF